MLTAAWKSPLLAAVFCSGSCPSAVSCGSPPPARGRLPGHLRHSSSGLDPSFQWSPGPPRSVLSPRQFLLQPCLPFRPTPALSHPLLQGKGPLRPYSAFHLQVAWSPCPRGSGIPAGGPEQFHRPLWGSPPWAVQVRGCSTSGFVSILEFVF